MLDRTLNSTLARAASLLTVALLLSAGAPAENQPRQARVAYADLNLMSEAGAATFLDRLESASRRVCDSGSGPAAMAQRLEADRCRDRAIRGGLAQVVAFVPVHDRLREPVAISRR